MNTLIKKFQSYISTGKFETFTRDEKDYVGFALRSYQLSGSHPLFLVLAAQGENFEDFLREGNAR